MSMSYRESSNAGKAAKRSIVEQRPQTGSRKKPNSQEVVIESRRLPSYAWSRVNDWRKWGSYRSLEVATETMAILARKNTYNEFRIKPHDAPV